MTTALRWRHLVWLGAAALAALLVALWWRWGETIFAGQLGAMLC